ncbi:PREDICTED: ubiquitin-conjugating enzyme E2 variant 3 [Dipodomys ordii]|uniref:Ubiquitin-conjugating enzyme E2 variant 3 n=1 Tax=Dipodomys ordii TaxID=10020 RepID=A0A1S3FES6_DIPOR|nr:PREDICTED: ubiquitin-conjugating enzyme E2 variant 3 [Dipodomys ordii]
MEFDCEGVRRLLGKYKFRDLTVEELKNVNTFFPHFRYSMDTYVFKDSSQKDLLNFTGTIPVMYQGNTYNIPIRFWILDSHPFAPPICFLKPTANMGISVGKHVDAQGRIYLPYLQNWNHFLVVIFTVNSLGNSESYLDVVQSNVDMFRTLVPTLGHYSQNGVLLVASQPVEIMTYVTWKLSAFPANQVIGTGCNLDSQRLQYIITNVLKAQSSGKDIWVIGEQGEDKEIADKNLYLDPEARNRLEAPSVGFMCRFQLVYFCINGIITGIADRLVLLDLSEGTKGGTMDLDIFNLPHVEISKDLSASAHSKVVIFTVNSLGNSESYLDVVQSNVDMFRTLVPTLGHYSQNGVLLVASQPVEIMTYVTWKLSAFPANQVIGTGCNLDSQRLQYIITNVLKAQSSGKDIWVIGEQGEDKGKKYISVSYTNKILSLKPRAMELLRVKGQRSWSVGLSVADLVDSIVNNKKKVHSVSVFAKGYYDIHSEVFLSLPCILGATGVSEVIRNTVKEDTVAEKLQSSASTIHGLQQQLKL